MSLFAAYTDSIQFNYRNNSPIEPIFHSHSRYEVYYFHSGSCNYLIGDKIYSLSPGDLILMNGMTLHCAKTDPCVDYIRSIVHYNPAALQPFLEPQHAVNILQPFEELGNYRISFRGSAKDEAEQMLQGMHSQYIRRDQIGYNRFLLAFVDFLYFIYEHCQTPLKDLVDLPSEKEKTVQRIISFIERNYTEDLHLEQLQQHLHLSKFYLSKMFKEITGVTIFDFLYQRRINQAKIQFILDPALSVTEVCFQVGFKHLAHFSRIFKKQVGLTPEQYKKSVRTPAH
ncbi:AraC family transcriptional regulator [Paenibacillus xerothermodurans]|uniref:AraC family transcriptional regulator n=1 Tax=Paenibacillus xerothermodurans TaxID=1977292 RepID=A0A2W1NAC6_PAEXE|nr:AraC family transcriptional regulator [Paenibacillus xerothermodurans]PZE21337.1 AraC family transcriptional regulator [Paenibacillus xerothermodurans]